MAKRKTITVRGNRLTDDEEWNYVLSESNNIIKGRIGYVYKPSILRMVEERLKEYNTEYKVLAIEDYWVIYPKYRAKQGGKRKCKKEENVLKQEETLEIFTLE